MGMEEENDREVELDYVPSVHVDIPFLSETHHVFSPNLCEVVPNGALYLCEVVHDGTHFL